MTASNEQSQAERIELPFTQDSNAPALSKIIPILTNTDFKAELKLYRKEQQSSIVFERNFKCEPVLCNKSCSQKELEAQLGALAKEWMHQTLSTELIKAVTDERAPHAGALTKLSTVKINEDSDDSRFNEQWNQMLAYYELDSATDTNNQSGHWSYKATLQSGPAYIYGDVYQLMLAQSEKMGASLSDVVRYMTLVLPALVIPFFTAKNGGFSSAYDMLKVAFPELKIITLPELDQDNKQFALLLCDDPAYGKPGYLVLRDGQPIRAFDPDDLITAIKYDLAVPEHKLVITTPEQIAVLEGI